MNENDVLRQMQAFFCIKGLPASSCPDSHPPTTETAIFVKSHVPVKKRLIWILARYDIVRLRTMSYVHPTTSYVRRTMSYSTSYIRYRMYDITYDIVHTTSYVCQHRRYDIRHRMSDIRYRRFRKIHVVYDIVCQKKPTMS